MNDRFTGWRKANYSGGSAACVEVAAGWRKSSYSDANGNCVEISGAERVIGVRDTKQREAGLVMEIPGSAWQAFLSEVKSGRLDC